MTLTPVGPMVLVELADEDDRPGPLIRPVGPDSRRPRIATVIVCGPGSLSTETGLRYPPELHPGDRVLLDPNTETHESPLLNPGTVLVNEADIAAVVAVDAQVVI